MPCLGFPDLGNVWELCADDWSENYNHWVTPGSVVTDPLFRGGGRQLCRGGSFYTCVLDARSCRREYMELYESEVDVGFRVVREISSL